jgi:TolC family type I secretion outer membrane protein
MSMYFNGGGKCLWGVVLVFSFSHLSVSIAQMTLYEALESALRNNPQVRASAAKVVAAKKGVEYARSQFYPKLDLSASYREQAPEVSFRVPAIGMGVGPSEITVIPHSYRELNLQLLQPLYTGGRLEAAYGVAKKTASMAELQHVGSQLQLVRNVRHSYFSVLEAEALVEVANAALKRVEELRRVVGLMFEAGRVAKFEVLRVEAELAQVRDELIRAQNALEVARSAFNTLLARDISEPVQLVGVSEPPQPPEILTREDAEKASIELAKSQRADLRAAMRAVELAEEQVRLARADGLPVVSLATTFRRQTKTGFAAAEAKAGMLTVQVPVFDSGRVRAQVEKAEAELKSAKELLSGVEKQVELEVKQAILNWRSAQERYKAAIAALEQAEEAYRIAMLRYEAGTGTQLEVLDAQVALTRARTNHVKALYDLHRAVADFEFAIGKPVELILADLRGRK